MKRYIHFLVLLAISLYGKNSFSQCKSFVLQNDNFEICNNTQLTFKVLESGGNAPIGPISFQWSEGVDQNGKVLYTPILGATSSTLTINVSQSTSFRVNVTESNCPTQYLVVNVEFENPPASPPAISNSYRCEADNNATFTVGNNDSNVNYEWWYKVNGTYSLISNSGQIPVNGELGFTLSGGNNSQLSVWNVTQSLMEFRVRSVNNCTASSFSYAQLIEVPPVSINIYTSINSLCYNSGNYNLDNYVEPSGGTWKINGTSNSVLSSTTAGNHTLLYTYTDPASGCVSYSSRVVNVKPPLNPGSINGTKTICYNASAGTLGNVSSASGGNSSYSYQWQVRSPGGTWGNISGATSEDYTLSTTPSSEKEFQRRVISCGQTAYSNIVKVTVIEPALPVAPSVSQQCNQTVLTKGSAPSGYTYYWQGTNSNGTSTATVNASSTYTVTSNGTYYIRAKSNTVANCWGPSRSVSVTVVKPSLPVAPSVSQQCNQTVLTKGSAPSGYTYYWQGTNSNGTSTATVNAASTYTATNSGTYYIRAKSNTVANCWGPSRSISVTVAKPLMPTVPTENKQCDQSILTKASAPFGYTYYWQGTNSNGTSTATVNASSTYTVTSNGTYYIRAKSNTVANCWGPARSISVTLNTSPEVASGSTISLFSFEGNRLLSGTGESPAGGTFSGLYVSNNTFNASQSGAGNHTVTYTYTNAHGCSASSTKTITVQANPVMAMDGSEDIVWGEERELTVPTGFAAYQWYKDGAAINGATNNAYTVKSVGEYYVKITAASGASLSLSPASFINLSSQQNENFVQTISYKTARKEGETVQAIGEVMEQFTYYDGLGRPMQTVQTQASPTHKDMIKPVAYDEFGRVSKDYLPYAANKKDGVLDPLALKDATGSYEASNQYTFYANGSGHNRASTNYPYAEIDYEPSPLNRAVAQYAPGEEWSKEGVNGGKAVTTDYLINSEEDAVKEFKIINGQLQIDGNFAAAVFEKILTTDENGNQSATFTNAFGKTLLKRNYGGNGEQFDTYYVYDVYDNLRFVIPPEAVNQLTITTGAFPTTLLNQFVFQYKYDGRNRMIEKKVPGAEPVMMVYDDRDRLVLTQDGEQRKSDQWLFTKYDALNRPIATGFYSNADNRATTQSYLNDFYKCDLEWIGSAGITNENNIITKNISNGWNAGIHSGTYIGAGKDGIFRFKSLDNTKSIRIGFSESHIDFNASNIDYSIYLQSNKHVTAYKNGSQVSGGSLGTYNGSDIFSIERIADTVFIKKNDHIIFKFEELSSSKLIMDISLYTTGGAIEILPISFYETKGNEFFGYSNNSFPLSIESKDFLSLTYYDDYNFFHAQQAGFEYEPNQWNTDYNQQVKGLVTGNMVRVLGSSQFLRSINYYDDKYRLIQSKTDNHKGGVDEVSNEYDFIGKTLQTSTKQVKPASILFRNQSNVIPYNGGFKSTKAGWAGQFSSVNRLKENEDGWIETRVDEVGSFRFFGFSEKDISPHADMLYKIYLYGRSLRAYHSGGNTVIASLTEGDIIRLDRTSGIVSVLLNGEKIYEFSNPSTQSMVMDASLHTNGTLTGLKCSFEVPIEEESPYNIHWTNLRYINEVDGTLTKTVNGWNGNGASINKLQAGKSGWVEFEAITNDKALMVGLSDKDESTGYNTLDYALYLRTDGVLYIMENGSSRGAFGNYISGDKFRVGRSGQTIYYEKNGVVLYTSETESKTDLILDLAFNTVDAAVKNFSSSFYFASSEATEININESFTYDHADRLMKVHHEVAEPLVWESLTGLEVDENNDLTHTGAEGYSNSNAYSKQKITLESNGYFSIQAEDIDRLLFGLNDDPTNTSYTDMDYAIYMAGNSKLHIYENGGKVVAADNLADYAVGDIMRVVKIQDQIHYQKNGETFFTSTKAVVTDLYPDVTTFYVGDRITNAMVSTTGRQLMVSNEYNELGELVTKNLHEDGDQFAQSVDYRYNTRGWLERINHADLSADNANEAADLFGMELGYTDNFDMGSTPQFNGNIAAIKWGGKRNDISQTEAIQQNAYGYAYDPLNRIKEANYFEGVAQSTSQKYQLRINEYDRNGNIMLLQRRDATGALMDDLTYNYANNGNRLNHVTDAGNVEEGFKDGNTTGNDYTYDDNGNLKTDANKEITSITYNYLNLPEEVNFVNGNQIRYIYDASGIKQRQEVYEDNNLIKATDYIGSLILENDTLQFIQTAEGRIVPQTVDGTDKNEYQYHLKDHLGNVRTTFAVRDEDYSTDFETADNPYFDNYDQITRLPNLMKKSGSYSHKLAGGSNETVGLMKSLAVSKGDKVSAEVYGKYLAVANQDDAINTGALITALVNMLSGGAVTGEGNLVSDNLTSGFTSAAIADDSNEQSPRAYLNYIMLDANFNYVNSGFDRLSASAADPGDGSGTHQKLSFEEILIDQDGYLLVFLSNESQQTVEVFWDDFRVDHHYNAVLQADDYYPFGLTFNSYQRSYSKANNFKYNGKELQEDLNTYGYEFRMFDPIIGRWWQQDPVMKDHESPYASVTNNPIRFFDAVGLDTVDINKNNDGVWEITNTQIVEGDDIFRVTSDGETSSYTFSEGEYGERINMLNLETNDDYTLGVFHISGEKMELGRAGYYVTPGGDASTEVGSNSRLPADTYNLQSSPSTASWRQIWVTKGRCVGDVSPRGIKFHFGGSNPADWTQGCFILSSSYTKNGSAVRYNFDESRTSTMLMDFHMGATSIFIYDKKRYNGRGRIGASFRNTNLNYKLILKDGFQESN
ncbi:hypothetical protein JKA74_20305 [Marivirga sp. S37H4]|uniref:DUF6443 domain-containing protein n=1 Tax=Marivirga aurantiaca TaxID=2802615 RepID=A0A934X2Q7_9BACT|nr:DUF6443 domain-containing protein [Marivirga aurantiaca]MBK6267396.1 hypothetical protein [Marivirga aurantiaca]